MMRQDVHLFVFDGLSDWEIGYAVAGINNPQLQREPGRYRVQTVSVHAASVRSVGGLRIEADLALERLAPAQSALLILPGGAAWDCTPESGPTAAAVDVARAFLAAGVPVAAICGATAGLARGGLLDHRRHTSNARDYLAATGYAGAALYAQAPAVSDGDLITASGLAPVDFAQHVFRRLEVYSPAVLDAWFRLFKTGNPEYFGALMQAVSAQSVPT